jgi:hypothetical protein
MHVVHGTALRTHAPARKPLDERFTRDVEQQHRIERLADLGEQVVERSGLLDVARESIEDESVRGIRSAEPIANEAENDIVGHELPGFHHGLGLQSELGAASNGIAQQVARRHLGHAVLRL